MSNELEQLAAKGQANRVAAEQAAAQAPRPSRPKPIRRPALSDTAQVSLTTEGEVGGFLFAMLLVALPLGLGFLLEWSYTAILTSVLVALVLAAPLVAFLIIRRGSAEVKWLETTGLGVNVPKYLQQIGLDFDEAAMRVEVHFRSPVPGGSQCRMS